MNDLSINLDDPILEQKVLRSRGEPPTRSFLTPLISHPFDPFEHKRRETPPWAVPVTIDGITYSSMKAACKALDCSYDKVHRLAGGAKSRHTEKPFNMSKAHGRKISLDGVEYESIAAAARAFDRSYSWIYRRIGEEHKSTRRQKK